jgi:phosphoribosylamine--glycine ligase
MNVLIIGSGGREHALAVSVARSPRLTKLFCSPGNAGTAELGKNVSISPDDIAGLLDFAQKESIDLTIVGPEAPLCAGVVDQFEAKGLKVFGPTASAAKLEGDKAFAKKIMRDHLIPTGDARVFDRYTDARTYIATRDSALVVKAAGLAAGKGVFVCDDPSDALLAAERLMVDEELGEAGRRIVVEERLTGPELSILALVSGSTIYLLESSQDHKRLNDGDKGPNTGGMGAYSPAPMATDDVLNEIQAEVFVPVVDAMNRLGTPYRGVLYAGLMLTAAGPKVLEFNCRFGDPEAQVILPRLKTDFLEAAAAVVDDRLDELNLEWHQEHAVCVVMASGGYPGSYKKGLPIDGIREAGRIEGVTVYHAGTRRKGNQVVTDGGRVLGATALGESTVQASAKAYQAVERIRFNNSFFRTDIAHQVIKAHR